MSFFNLTMMGHQEPIKHHQLPEAERSLPPINCPKIYTRHFSKPFDSNLKYHELRTKHIRHPQGKAFSLFIYYRLICQSRSVRIGNLT